MYMNKIGGLLEVVDTLTNAEVVGIDEQPFCELVFLVLLVKVGDDERQWLVREQEDVDVEVAFLKGAGDGLREHDLLDQVEIELCVHLNAVDDHFSFSHDAHVVNLYINRVRQGWEDR